VKPKFEEKSYESAANGELQVEDPRLFSPGQIAERLLGFDAAAAQPASAAVWTLLGQGMPSGLQLVPNLWPPHARPGPDVALPGFPVSVVLQYKRADFLTRAIASQYDHWQAPYYRFRLTEHQQETLAQLERAVGLAAVVRYASPVFHEYEVLEHHQLNRRILQNSNFVSPQKLTNGHSVWTYQQAGNDGYANPEGEKIPAENWAAIQQALASSRSQRTILEHLRELAGAFATARLARPRVTRNSFGTDVRLPEDPGLFQGLLDLFTIGTVVGRVAASWWVRFP
jgi:hypothetical protein